MKGSPRTGASSASSDAGERGELGGEGGGVGGVGGGVVRVGLGQRRGDRGRGRGGVLGVEPEVAVGSAGGRGRRVGVGVRLERAAGADRQRGDAGGVFERYERGGRGECCDRAGKPGGEGGADPDDEVGVLEQRRLGRAQRVVVLGGAGRHDQLRRGDAGHDAGGDRMDRRDVGGDARRGRGCAGGEGREEKCDQPAHCSSPLPRPARYGPCRGSRRRLGCRSDPVPVIK